MGKWLLTILFLIGSAFLTRLIPFLSFFRYLDTMIHEFGHALTALMFSGRVMYIELYADHSGVTQTLLTKPWSTVPVALSGYMTASLFAWLLFAWNARGMQRQGLMLVTALAAVSLLFFVRNGYGMGWLAGFLALNFIVLVWAGRRVTQGYYWVVAFLSLEESVMGPISLTLQAWNQPTMAGDASLLAKATPLAAPVWGIFFCLFSLWCAKNSLQAFFGRRKRKIARIHTNTPVFDHE